MRDSAALFYLFKLINGQIISMNLFSQLQLTIPPKTPSKSDPFRTLCACKKQCLLFRLQSTCNTCSADVPSVQFRHQQSYHSPRQSHLLFFIETHYTFLSSVARISSFSSSLTLVRGLASYVVSLSAKYAVHGILFRLCLQVYLFYGDVLFGLQALDLFCCVMPALLCSLCVQCILSNVL